MSDIIPISTMFLGWGPWILRHGTQNSTGGVFACHPDTNEMTCWYSCVNCPPRYQRNDLLGGSFVWSVTYAHRRCCLGSRAVHLLLSGFKGGSFVVVWVQERFICCCLGSRAVHLLLSGFKGGSFVELWSYQVWLIFEVQISETSLVLGTVFWESITISGDGFALKNGLVGFVGKSSARPFDRSSDKTHNHRVTRSRLMIGEEGDEYWELLRYLE